jgi:hypothetical protein
MARVANTAQAAEWAERLRRFEASGLTVARFCKAERVSTASLYLWRKKLGKRPATKVPRPHSQAFRPVDVLPSSVAQAQRPTTIRLPEGMEIELGSDLQLAGQVVKSLVKQLVRMRESREDSPC